MANDNKLVNLADLKEAFDDVKESIPSKTSQLTNDSGYITGYTETDPTVPSWAKASSKPSYSASEVGAKSTQTAVNSPTASGTALAFIDTISQNAQGVITPTKKTVAGASQSAAGLMSADDKKKLDGIASGATANAGTVTSIATGVGLTGGTITGSGTLKAKLRSETALTMDSAAATTTSGRVYPVAVDKTGYLAVNVPWTDNNTTYSAGTGLTLSGTTFSNSGVTSVNNQTGAVSITPANIGAVAKSGDTITGPLVINNGSGTGVKIYADAEGGNIAIHSPSGHIFEFDAFDDNSLRCYARDSESVTTDSCHFTFNRVTGELSATGGFAGNATSATNVSGIVETNHGGTGATNAASARANLGITPANIGAAPAEYVQYDITVPGGTHIAMPTGDKDMIAFINVSGYKFIINIPKIIGWTGTTHNFPFGVYDTESGIINGQLKIDAEEIWVAKAKLNGNDILNGTSLTIYRR